MTNTAHHQASGAGELSPGARRLVDAGQQVSGSTKPSLEQQQSALLAVTLLSLREEMQHQTVLLARIAHPDYALGHDIAVENASQRAADLRRAIDALLTTWAPKP